MVGCSYAYKGEQKMNWKLMKNTVSINLSSVTLFVGMVVIAFSSYTCAQADDQANGNNNSAASVAQIDSSDLKVNTSEGKTGSKCSARICSLSLPAIFHTRGSMGRA